MARQEPYTEPPTNLEMLEIFARDLRRCIDRNDIEQAQVTARLIELYAKDVQLELTLEEEE